MAKGRKSTHGKPQAYMYDCSVCGKASRSDRLGYEQGMIAVWKYGSDALEPLGIDRKSSTYLCTACLNAVLKVIKSRRAEHGN